MYSLYSAVFNKKLERIWSCLYTVVFILVEGLDLGECVENLEVVNDTIENKNEFIQQYTSDLEHPLVSW